MISVLRLELPIRVPSVANLREHHHARARRVKVQREGTRDMLRLYGVPSLPITVELTRIASTRIKDEHDNLKSAFKAIADGVADWLGCDDSHPGITWLYAQEYRASEGMLMLFSRMGHMKRVKDQKIRIEVLREQA